MQRFVLEPVLLAIFSELLFPNEPVEYLMPYSTVLELYELQESDQIVTDSQQNELVKQNLEQVIAFFEQPFVRKKMERILRMPWSKSTPILFSEQVQFTIVFSIDNAEFGDKFDPIETELLLLARREQLPIISDQLPFQQRIAEANIPVTVLDVAEFGFFVEDSFEDTFFEEEFGLELTDLPPEVPNVAVKTLPESIQPRKKERPLYPFIIGGFLLILIVSLYQLFR